MNTVPLPVWLKQCIASADLDALKLIKPGSSVGYRVLLKVNNETQLNSLAAQIKTVLAAQENVETYLTAQSGVQRFFNNFLFFLNLVGIFTLLLAGIGIQSALTVLLVTGVGMAASLSILRSKPITYLREQTSEE